MNSPRWPHRACKARIKQVEAERDELQRRLVAAEAEVANLQDDVQRLVDDRRRDLVTHGAEVARLKAERPLFACRVCGDRYPSCDPCGAGVVHVWEALPSSAPAEGEAGPMVGVLTSIVLEELSDAGLSAPKKGDAGP